jgi:hypothetical protein
VYTPDEEQLSILIMTIFEVKVVDLNDRDSKSLSQAY